MWVFGKVKNMIPDACIVHRSNEFLLPILLLQATVTTTKWIELNLPPNLDSNNLQSESSCRNTELVQQF
jgi:hypothetical protein